MRKFIFTILLFVPVLSVSSVYAGNMCLKVYGSTPEKAFQAGVEQLAEAESKPENWKPPWRKPPYSNKPHLPSNKHPSRISTIPSTESVNPAPTSSKNVLKMRAVVYCYKFDDFPP